MNMFIRRDPRGGFLVPANPITAVWVATPPLQQGVEIAGILKCWKMHSHEMFKCHYQY